MGIPGRLRMPHAMHINLNNLTCIDCHNHVTHAPPGQSNAVSMGPCTMCHEQTTDPSAVPFCHYTPPTGYSPPHRLHQDARLTGVGRRARLPSLSP